MATAFLRNLGSGEIREVEADSQEYYKLRAEVRSTGMPMWEQTGPHHALAIRERAATGDLYEEDLGWDPQNELRYEALKLAQEGVAPENNPHLFLTPGEIESGLTPKQKQKDLAQMYAQKVGRRSDIFLESARVIHGDEPDVEEPAPLQGQHSAFAGGSDDRENAPPRGAFASESGGDDVGQVAPSTGSPAGQRQGGGTGGGRKAQSSGSKSAQSSQSSSGESGGGES